MDSSRASSIYSIDTTKKPSYLDTRPNLDSSNRVNSFKAARDYAESLSLGATRPSPPVTAPAPVPAPALASMQPPALATMPASTTSCSSPKPSFMNYRDEREDKSPTIAIPERSAARKAVPFPTPAAPAPTRRQGMLLLAIVGEIHPRTMHYLGILLKKHSYSGVAIVGSTAQEVAIKELKMEVYALIGQLRQEIIVSTHSLDEWKEENVSAILQKASGNAEATGSVLCTPSCGQTTTSASDILSLDKEELLESWSRSVGFLHAVAKATIPRMMEGRTGMKGSNCFVILAAPATSPGGVLNQTTCNALVNQLREAYSGPGLTVGQAEEVLVPELEPVHTNGNGHVSNERYEANESIFAPSESPTKLWNMWSLQNEIGE